MCYGISSSSHTHLLTFGIDGRKVLGNIGDMRNVFLHRREVVKFGVLELASELDSCDKVWNTLH